MKLKILYISLYCIIMGVSFTAAQFAVERTRCCGATDAAALSALLRPQFLVNKVIKNSPVLWEFKVHQCAH